MSSQARRVPPNLHAEPDYEGVTRQLHEKDSLIRGTAWHVAVTKARQGGSKQQERTRGWAGPGLSGDSNKSPLPRLAKLEDDGNRVLVLAWLAYQEMRIMGLLAISYGDSAKGCSRGQTQARSGFWPLGNGVRCPSVSPMSCIILAVLLVMV
ncbi:hypothetical protein V2G26_020869 [Clonostachys chloroleuca]